MTKTEQFYKKRIAQYLFLQVLTECKIYGWVLCPGLTFQDPQVINFIIRVVRKWSARVSFPRLKALMKVLVDIIMNI